MDEEKKQGSLLPELHDGSVFDLQSDSLALPDQVFADSGYCNTGIDDVLNTVEIETSSQTSLARVENAVNVVASNMTKSFKQDLKESITTSPASQSIALSKSGEPNLTAVLPKPADQSTPVRMEEVQTATDTNKQGTNQVFVIPIAHMDPSVLQSNLKVPPSQNVFVIKPEELTKAVQEQKEQKIRVTLPEATGDVMCQPGAGVKSIPEVSMLEDDKEKLPNKPAQVSSLSKKPGVNLQAQDMLQDSLSDNRDLQSTQQTLRTSQEGKVTGVPGSQSNAVVEVQQNVKPAASPLAAKLKQEASVSQTQAVATNGKTGSCEATSKLSQEVHTALNKATDGKQQATKKISDKPEGKASPQVTGAKLAAKAGGSAQSSQTKAILQVPKVIHSNVAKAEKPSAMKDSYLKTPLNSVPKITSENKPHATPGNVAPRMLPRVTLVRNASSTGPVVARGQPARQATPSVRAAVARGRATTTIVRPGSKGVYIVRPSNNVSPAVRPVNPGAVVVRPSTVVSPMFRLVRQGSPFVRPANTGASVVRLANQAPSVVRLPGTRTLQSRGNTTTRTSQSSTRMTSPSACSPASKPPASTPSVWPTGDQAVVSLKNIPEGKPSAGRGGRPRKDKTSGAQAKEIKKPTRSAKADSLSKGPTLSGELEKRSGQSSHSGRLKGVRFGVEQLKPLKYSRVSASSPWKCSLCGKTSFDSSLGCLYGPYDETKDASQSDHQELERKRKHDSATDETESPSKVVKADLSSATRDLWFHGDCLVWSPGIYVVGDCLAGYKQAVSDGRLGKCCRCGDYGATLVCLQRTCKKHYHFVCAKKAGCAFEESNYTIQCGHHK